MGVDTTAKGSVRNVLAPLLVDIEDTDVYKVVNGGSEVFVESYKVPRNTTTNPFTYTFNYSYTITSDVGDSVVIRFKPSGLSADIPAWDEPAFVVSDELIITQSQNRISIDMCIAI